MRHRLFVLIVTAWFAWRAAVAGASVFGDGWYADVPAALFRTSDERTSAFLGADAALYESLNALVPEGGSVFFHAPRGGNDALLLSTRLRAILFPRELRWVWRLPALRPGMQRADGSLVWADDELGRLFVVEYEPLEASSLADALELVEEQPSYRLWRNSAD